MTFVKLNYCFLASYLNMIVLRARGVAKAKLPTSSRTIRAEEVSNRFNRRRHQRAQSDLMRSQSDYSIAIRDR